MSHADANGNNYVVRPCRVAGQRPRIARIGQTCIPSAPFITQLLKQPLLYFIHISARYILHMLYRRHSLLATYGTVHATALDACTC